MKKSIINKIVSKKHFIKIIICIGMIAVIGSFIAKIFIFNQPRDITLSAFSSVLENEEIAELSTSEFQYRGIAEMYTDESKTKIRCRVCYKAVVKAGIDMKEVRLEADPENKILHVFLPEIGLNVTIVDEQSMTLLPKDVKDIEVAELLRSSKEDAEKEARNSEELIRTARENAKEVIEGLLYPVLKTEGYTLSFNY